MARILRVLSSTLALALIIASLIITIIIGFPQNLAKNSASNFQTLALIDTSTVETRTPQQTYHGLPDTHDYSKHKDFFALYIHTYCSGTKEKDGKYVVDFCANVGSVFDQYRVWKIWGVDLGEPDREEENKLQETVGVGAIRTMPKVIFGWFLAGTVLSILTLINGLFALCTSWAKRVALFFASVATVSCLVTAVLAQIFYPTLVKRTDGYKVVAKNGAGGGTLTAQLGKTPLAGLWLVVVFSFLSSLLLAAALHSDRKAKAAKRENGFNREKDSRMKEYQLSPTSGKAPTIATHAVPRGVSPHIVPGIIRRATGKFFGATGLSRYDDTSYETLRVAGAEPRGRSRSRDPSRSRGESPGEKSVDTVVAPTEDERTSRYEPFRHHTGP